MLLKAENLNQIKFKTKKVNLTKADAEIFVALLPASIVKEAREFHKAKDANTEMDIEKQADDECKMKEFGFKIISAGVIDDKGLPVFKSVDEFENLPVAIQDEIQEAVFDYNGLSKSSQKQLEKN